MSLYLDKPLRSLETALRENKSIEAVFIASFDIDGWVLARGERAIDNTVYPTKEAALNAGLDVK